MNGREPYLGLLDRDGVGVAYEIHGSGTPTILLLPAFPINDKRLWKLQVPHLARNHRVLVLEPRGHGRSDRSTDPAQYTWDRRIADIVALLDETDTDEAVVVGLSQGAPVGVELAAAHPDRVSALVTIGGSFGLGMDYDLGHAIFRFTEDLGRDDGVWRFNQHSWRRDFEGFVRYFTELCFNEPHSTLAHEEGVEYGLETTAEVLTAHMLGHLTSAWQARPLAETAADVRCPVLLVHGTADEVCPSAWSAKAASLLGGRLELIDGGSHGVHARRPATVNTLIDDFLAEHITPPERRPRRSSAGPRVLYLSSPIGLGHVRRDVAIAEELRALAPDATIEWLAQDPVTRVLADRGEAIHPASRALHNECAHLFAATDDHDLHVFEAFRRMDRILVANFMVFEEAVREGRYDLVVGDEAWDVDHFLHEEPSLKRTRFAWLTDFVGHLPMPGKGPRDVELTADYNLEMLEHVERHPEIRDLALFVGEPTDVVDASFGPGLPGLREWTEDHYDFTGYITGFDPAEFTDRQASRGELGCPDDAISCIASVGGSGIGEALLRLVIDAHRIVHRELPGLHTTLVTGPRLDPDSLPDAPGVVKRSYIPDLHRHLAAADLAVVQGGLTTTMELTASGTPFLYVPLLNHFEQQIHVRHRLERHRAGTAIDYATTTAESLAAAMLDALAAPVDYAPVPTDGAARAARRLVPLLG